jgi:PAS domain S-box-containing protein
MSAEKPKQTIVVRETEIVSVDTRQQYRQKIARITLDSMVQFVGLLDANGTVLEINKVALDAVGIKLADVEGKPFWTTFWWQVSDASNAELREMIRRAAAGEFVRWDTEIYGRASGKETIIIDASLMPVTDDNGNVVFICAEGRDITEKKAQEREIEQKNIELQGLLERIRELDEIKTQFFANVSHELRTPLALILGPAQRLIDDEGLLTRSQRRDSAQVISRNARMLLKHVNDLLDMSKIDAGKLKIDLQETDIGELVRFLASHFSVLAAERGIEYVIDAGAVCPAAVDSDKLQRVVMNLLANAFKFVPDGGRIRCSIEQSSGEFTVCVEDSGPGVSEDLRQAIFERFRQLDGGSSRRVGGTGLGLAIAKEFVEMHKGQIAVLDSDLGGARFLITIPVHHLSQRATSNELVRPATGTAVDGTLLQGLIDELRPEGKDQLEEAVTQVGPRPRILVVEDNRDMNKFIGECLSPYYEVISAFDGREGLEKAMKFKPSLVLSDIMMPNVSGDEMLSEMRQLPDLNKTPVLLLSAKADETLMVRLLDEGAQDFIVKPFAEKDLIVRVRNLIVAEEARQEALRSLAREHKAREEAEMQKQLLHSLFMQSPTLIAVLRGPEFIVEMANPPLCNLWGLNQSDVINRPLAELRPTIRHQGFLALLNRVYQTGEPHVGKETPAVFEHEGQARTRYFNYMYSPFRSIQGDIEGIFAISSEVTAQVLAREQVEGLREAAESANRTKDEFLAMLGHELRNPLSPIVTALHLMKLRPDDSERARIVIERQVNHLVRLVDDLLDVSRIARGKVELKKEPLEIWDVVSKGIEMVSPLVEQRGHTLTVDVPATGLQVDGDPTRLSQVFSNLLTNAAKYTTNAGHITVRAVAVDKEIVLSVRDTGIGIAPEVLGRIFDLFVQERQAVDRSQGGMGLGLTIVRNLIQLHGGSVVAKSDGVGQGSEFIVRLPRITRGPDHGNSSDFEVNSLGSIGPRAGAPRILIVDDNEDAAAMLEGGLILKGHITRVAHDAPAALQIAAQFLPDVAFIDIGLPVMDGYELASHLRSIPELANLRLIALTGYGQPSDRQKTLQAGFHRHLVKPVNFDELEDAMTVD